MGHFYPGDNPLQTVEGGVLVGCVQTRKLSVWVPRPERFILLLSFSYTLFVVSILDIVYDSRKSGAIDVTVGRTVFYEQLPFKMLDLSFSSKLD